MADAGYVRMLRRFGRWGVVVWTFWVAGAGLAQLDRLSLSVAPEDIGVGGYVRPGQWTPMRVTLDNPSADDVEVTLTWPVRDADGDIAEAQRTAVINAQRTEQMWLYAPLPMNARPETPWTLRVDSGDTDAQGRSVGLADPVTVRLDPGRWLPPGTGAIAVMSGQDLGLDDYARQSTQHEAIQLIQDVSLEDLPDAPHGLAGLDAIVWTADTGADPADPTVSSAVLTALREYVLRGGHLVVVLPRVGQTWTQSPLADLLPVPAEAVRRVTDEPPRWGAVRLDELEAVSMHVFDVSAGSEAAVLLRDRQDRPVVVAARRGLGTVTLIGLDLTDAVFRRELASGDRRGWHAVFGYSAPAFTPEKEELETGRVVDSLPAMRPTREMDSRPLGDFVPGRVAMRGTVAALTLVAVALLLLYIAAAAASFLVVRKRGVPQQAWVAFAVVVAAFSALAWGGAWAARPSVLRASHVSVLDVVVPRGESNPSSAAVRSWVSLFVPRFGTADVALGEGHAGTLGSLGFAADGLGTGFLDAETYAVDAQDPTSLTLPVRSTTRRLTIDATTSRTRNVDADRSATGRAAQIGPAAFVADGRPSHNLSASPFTAEGLYAELRHALPGPLRDVTVIYCPGEVFRAGTKFVQAPWVWRPNVDPSTGERTAWEPGEVLAIAGRPDDAQPIVTIPRAYDDERQVKDEGFLGALLDQQGGVSDQLLVNDASVVRRLTLLSFYDALPPPKFTKLDWPGPFTLERRLGRELDLTVLLTGPRLIVLGHLRDSPLPLGLTVDGSEPPADGWTMVRLIYDL
ncbi:MAG: hypothetical protein AAGH92_08680 [Planctomycetota bacterium]